jgi:protocatechuate 3,4-dioxygenase beta subunit
VRVRDASDCSPLADAVVEVWHCDAAGSYSAFGSAEGEKYLRGAQVTNRGGVAEFTTIYPGWYPGRTVHIHAKVHLDNSRVLTTQLYFDDEFTERIYANAPYSQNAGQETLNSDDSIFDEALLLTLAGDGDGVTGVMTFDVQSA